MLPALSDNITVESTLDGQKVQMKFDENSLAHLMGLLTDLYSDPVLAVIREYSTNALDSHRAAGQTRPIEVTLPTALSPFFRVKDYGVGMNVDDITEIYSKYGASTKRETNEQVGMLGVGCKSALTYTSQFSVKGIKNGVKTAVSVSRNEDGTGTMEVVDTVSTNEPNGVEIIVPVNNHAVFNEKATLFFRFWEPKDVLIDGRPPVTIEKTEVGPGLFMSRAINRDYIVMGNVAYPTPGQADLYDGRSWNNNFGVIAYVNIGEVNFTPSRETLQMTPKTKATIERLKDEFSKEMLDAIQREIDSADTPAEGRKIYLAWKSSMPYVLPKGMAYRGTVIPESIVGKALAYNMNTYRNQAYTRPQWSESDLKDVLFIVNCGFDAMTVARKNRVKKYISDNNLPYSKTILIDGPMIGDVWLADRPTVEWSVLASMKMSDGVTRKKSSGKFEIYDSNRGWFVEADLSDKPSVIVDKTSAYGRPSDEQYKIIIAAGYQIVMLSANRHAKFLRENEGSKHWREIFKPMYNKAVFNLTDADFRYMALDNYRRQAYTLYDADRIDDVEVKQFLAELKTPKSERVREFERMSDVYHGFDITPLLPAVDNPFQKYTMLFTNGTTTLRQLAHNDHTYIMMNAVYAATKEN